MPRQARREGAPAEARHAGATVALATERTAQFAELIEADLREDGWSDVGASARLLVAAAAECAVAEFEAGRKLPTTRRVLAALARVGGNL